MKILLIGTNKFGGGYLRILAYQRFLQSRNHEVSVINIPNENLNDKSYYYYHSVKSQISNNFLYLVTKIGDFLEKKLSNNKYDAIICVETLFADILTKNLNCLKIFSCESLESEEKYYSGNYKFEDIYNIREKEYEIMDSADYVVFPWKTTEKYVKKYIYNDKKLLTIKYGCYPKNNKPDYFYPFYLISLGSLKWYWSNKELLSHITKNSTYNIHAYGKFKPEEKYKINYMGFAESMDILYKYQFGINTISKDIFRKNHFSSRIINYLAYGLPVLFPEWQEFPKELEGCVPYNEHNIDDVIENYSPKEKWEKLSTEAKNQGLKLDWNHTLKPLEKIVHN